MPTIQKGKVQEGRVTSSSTRNWVKAVEKLRQLVQLCRSPSGKLVVSQSLVGGSLVLTSSSKILIQSLTVKKPIIQLLISAAQGHLNVYGDGGLFVLSFTASLVSGTIKSGMNLKISAEIFEMFLTAMCDFINCDTCCIKYPALVGNTKFMFSVTKTIIQPKLGCMLDEIEISYISNLLLQCFLLSVNGTESCCVTDNVFITTHEGACVAESKVYDGLLLEAPDLSRYKHTALTPLLTTLNDRKAIKVVLVAVSLSGDYEETWNNSYKMLRDVDVEAEMLAKLLAFCESLIQHNVGLVLCQKVVHPLLKQHLGKAGVHVFDRIGLQMSKFSEKMAGCTAMQCLDGEILPEHMGFVDKMQHVILNDRSYVHLTRAGQPTGTLLLCHQQEHKLQELKCVCLSSLTGLEKLLFEPSVLPGAGCWQAVLVEHLLGKVKASVKQLCEELECSEDYILRACSVFTKALITSGCSQPSMLRRNNITGHVHRLSNIKCAAETECVSTICECGLFENKSPDNLSVFLDLDCKNVQCNKEFGRETDWKISDIGKHKTTLEEALRSRLLVLDSTGTCVNALQTAVLTACSVLRIGQEMGNF